jgi:7-cyano-7-deazaguanine reductase|tara:strand:- start:1427 stop:2344 length:918 start_codon:yes stop_codon:yes gene_type:complete
MSASNMSEAAAKSLGSANSYAVYTDTFDPNQLNPMPRILARQDWGITGDEFVGYDTWHCHEATFLLNNGLPMAGTLKIVCPASSEFMVESKSFKLYLNTFDMCKMGNTIPQAIENYEKQVAKDISACIGAEAKVSFFRQGEEKLYEGDPGAFYLDMLRLIGNKELEGMEITDYASKEPHFSTTISEEGEDLFVMTNLLRSRCRHTKQKDTGAAYFRIITKQNRVDLKDLLKEVIALREVNEFHEFCSEKLFKSIMSHPDVEDCVVMLLYARRGSLDINPVRASKEYLIPRELIDTGFYTKKAMGQ